ncbi:MAG: hypothetical protein ACOCXH_12415 [Cyclobacteriaceae bacterium]
MNGVKSKELLDYYRFEDIGYKIIRIAGEDIKNQYFILTSNEYWKGKLEKVDTIANTKAFKIRNEKDTLELRIMSKKTKSDTIKFQFYLPKYSTIRSFKTTPNDTYSLRDITFKGYSSFPKNKATNLLAYSLPYEDPERPGLLFYCELSREGISPEKWGDKFGVKHYIVFKFQIIE